MARTARNGALGGALFGAVFAAMFALAGWLVCSGNRECPGHWLPYLASALIVLAVCTVLGSGVAVFLRFLYRLTKV